ncbi:aspartate 1-decarboxylase [Candidatus Fermentibacterales bacterium]|nr:aspartate 1-decarboxylase [Candidatus Fermentibacterales bacterium]
MMRCFLGSKLHRMVVTEADPDYAGSITLDRDLLDLAGMLPWEKVLVGNLRNGCRFETYVIEAERGSGTVCVNGAAARLVSIGDRIIVMQFFWADPDAESIPRPRVVVANEVDNLDPRLLS